MDFDSDWQDVELHRIPGFLAISDQFELSKVDIKQLHHHALSVQEGQSLCPDIVNLCGHKRP